jgi:hypothetical protein
MSVQSEREANEYSAGISTGQMFGRRQGHDEGWNDAAAEYQRYINELNADWEEKYDRVYKNYIDLTSGTVPGLLIELAQAKNEIKFLESAVESLQLEICQHLDKIEEKTITINRAAVFTHSMLMTLEKVTREPERGGLEPAMADFVLETFAKMYKGVAESLLEQQFIKVLPELDPKFAEKMPSMKSFFDERMGRYLHPEVHAKPESAA